MMPDPETPTKTTFADDEKLVDTIQDKLDVFNEEEEQPVVESTETPVEEKPGVVDETSVETPGETDDVPAVEDEAGSEAAADESASTLPAAYRRSAKARGWTDEEIDQFHMEKTDLALQTFERMHTSRVAEVNEFADIGRRLRDAPPADRTESAPASDSQVELKRVDVEALIEKYGNEDLVRELAGPMNANADMLGPLVESIRTAQTQAKQDATDALRKTVDDFFTSESMAPYVEVYGKDSATVTADQVEARGKVLETADAIRAGMQYQGRDITVQDALALANDSVASKHKDKIIRDGLRKTVTKRAAGITLKPDGKGGRLSTEGGPPRDREELLTRSVDRLKRAFG